MGKKTNWGVKWDVVKWGPRCFFQLGFQPPLCTLALTGFTCGL